MSNVTQGFLDDVEETIKGMWGIGMIPSIQRLEVMMKDKHGANADMLRDAAKELLKQNRIASLPIDQPES